MDPDFLHEGLGAEPSLEGKWLRIWRPLRSAGVIAVHTRANNYEAEPHGEYVFAHLTERSIRAVRGRRHYLVRPGDLALWDSTAPHYGSVEVGNWESRALVIEPPSFADVITEPDGCALDLEFPDPVLRDPVRAAGFLRLHRTLTMPASSLEREVELAGWLRGLARLVPGAEQLRRREARRSARRDPALRRACELLSDDFAADVDLADLATAAGTSKFRLLRLFKTGLGLPPHAYQIQVRVQRARTLLELGEPPVSVAHSVGFYDQSHLSRHFRRRIGVTPGRYAESFTGRPRVAGVSARAGSVAG